MAENGKPTTVIEGAEPDYLLEAGKKPRVDVRREYIAGGDSSFPLVGQLELSRGVDDLARDLGMQVYDVMLNDPTVAGAIHVLITGILSGEFQVLPAISAEDGEEVEPGSEREQDIEIAKEEAAIYKRSIDRLEVPIKSICYDLMFCMAYGVRLAEKVFEEGEGEDEGRIVLKRLRVKRNQSWSFIVDPPGNTVAIRALCFDVGLHDLPPAKFLIASWMPRDADPRGRSLLRHAYNGWNLKINTWPMYFKYLETFGTPFVVGITAPDGNDEPELDDKGKPTGSMLLPTEAMGQALSNMKTASYVALRNGADVKFCQAVGNGEAFQSAFELYKHEILEGILMTARAVLEAKRSSKADADQAQDVVGQILIFGREFMENLFGRGVAGLSHQLCELNKGAAYAHKYAPHVSLGEVEHHDIAETATAYAALGYQLDPTQFPAADGKLGFPVRKNVTTDLAEQDGQPAEFSEREDGADPFRSLRRSLRKPVASPARKPTAVASSKS